MRGRRGLSRRRCDVVQADHPISVTRIFTLHPAAGVVRVLRNLFFEFSWTYAVLGGRVQEYNIRWILESLVPVEDTLSFNIFSPENSYLIKFPFSKL
jgi:hypothetical protein